MTRSTSQVGLGPLGTLAIAAWLASTSTLAGQAPTTTELVSGTTALLQAVSAPSETVVWVSGHEGAVLKSEDGGETWTRRSVPSLDSLQFRDIHAFDAQTAVILSAGPGAQSRVYRSEDGGGTWSLSWMNEEPEGFYDCLDFWDGRRGIAYGDAIEGGLRVLLTDDGGRTWSVVPPDRLPPAAGSEGGFAASGTCVTARPGGQAWIATGAGDRPRVLRTTDYGATWSASDVPLVSGEAAGAITIGFSSDDVGFVLGGDLAQADAYTDNVARSTDGGRTWVLKTPPTFAGAVYGSVLSGSPVRLVAAGPGGLAMSGDEAETWSLLDNRSFWAVGGVPDVAWAVGPEGRILKLEWNDQGRSGSF